MPKQTTKRVESVVYKGITFRRYPDSPNWSDKSYYRPNSKHIMDGVKSLHIEIWQDAHGPVPEGCHIHHKDGDTSNNSIENLECLTPKEHNKYHAENAPEEQTAWRRSHINEIRPLASAWHKSEEGRAWHRIIGAMPWDNAEYRTLGCQQCGKEYQTREMQDNHSRFCSNACKSAWRRDAGLDNETRLCKQCEKEFTCNKYDKNKFCSRECSFAWRYPNAGVEMLQCPVCETTFTASKSARRECCSKGCANTLRRLNREKQR